MTPRVADSEQEPLKSAPEDSLGEREEFHTRLIESRCDCIKVLDLEARLLSMGQDVRQYVPGNLRGAYSQRMAVQI